MNRMHTFWSFLDHYKYLIVVVAGIIVVGFVDENSFLRRITLDGEKNNLKEEITTYKKINENATLRLRELQQTPEAAEKIARERYFMKADNEDIYVLDSDPVISDHNDETAK